MRIRRSKSLAFVGRPTISDILTLESGDKQKYSSGYPYNAIYKTQSMIARRDKRRLLHLLSSRGGGPDDMREPFGPALLKILLLSVRLKA